MSKGERGFVSLAGPSPCADGALPVLTAATGKLAEYRYAFGKRRDGRGWDVLSIVDGLISHHGPYATRRAASTAITFGDVARERAERDGASCASTSDRNNASRDDQQ